VKFRAVIYYRPTSQQARDGLECEVALASEPLPTEEQATVLLKALQEQIAPLRPGDRLAESCGIIGGHVEVHVPGHGWVNTADADNVAHKMSDHVWQEQHAGQPVNGPGLW
jgi:hypothetical protein